MTSTRSSQQGRQEAEARVVSKHLPSGYSAEPDVLSDGPANPDHSPEDVSSHSDEAGPQDSLALQGGDVHREIFKISARAKLGQRAATFAQPINHNSGKIGDFERNITPQEQRAPGGFRREFVRRQQKRINSVTTPVTSSFVSFLDLYGNFAGEDLGESEDESDMGGPDGQSEEQPNETRPLLGRRKSSRRQPRAGDATTKSTFFTLLKAFIGTGIMFLPKAFKNGGILFSSIILISVSILSCICFRLLLQCRERYGGGYGELGAAVGGSKLRIMILSSIALSQIGFVCAGMIFIAENLYTFLSAVTPNHTHPLSIIALISLQIIVLVPLALINNISRLGPSAMLADVFILIGVTYIWYYDIATLSHSGIHPTVQLFNPSAWTLTIGSSIFTFEGIGLLLPIQSSMAQPQHFSALLYLVMVLITLIFTSIGALCYATFGANTSVEIISNYPQSSPLVNAVQFLYSLAVLAGTPVQLFPAARILESTLFGEGKKSRATKWYKNGLRIGTTLMCGIIAIAGASDLDKFVALIGSFACVPLVYIYPAFLHYKAIAETRREKAVDIVVMAVGFGAMVYTTAITISSWARQ